MTQPDTYMARSHRSDTLHSEQLADLMVQRGSILTKSDIIVAGNLRFEVIQEMLQPGFNIADQRMTMSRVRGTETLAAGKYAFLELRSNELRKEQLQDVLLTAS